MLPTFNFAEGSAVIEGLNISVDNTMQIITISGQATSLAQTVYVDIIDSKGSICCSTMTNTSLDGIFKLYIRSTEFKAPAGTYTVQAYNKTGDYQASGQFDYNPLVPTPTPVPTPTATKESPTFLMMPTYLGFGRLVIEGELSLGAGNLINIEVCDLNGMVIHKDQYTTTFHLFYFQTNINLEPGTYYVNAFVAGTTLKASSKLTIEAKPTAIPTPTKTPILPTPTKGTVTFSMIATYRSDTSLEFYGDLSLGGGYLINLELYDLNGMIVFKDQIKTTNTYYSYLTYISNLKPGTYNAYASVEGTTLKASHPVIVKDIVPVTPTPSASKPPIPTIPTGTIVLVANNKPDLGLIIFGEVVGIGQGYTVSVAVFDSNHISMFKGEGVTNQYGNFDLRPGIQLAPGTYTVYVSVLGTEYKGIKTFVVQPQVTPTPTPVVSPKPTNTPVPPVIKGSTIEIPNKYGWFNSNVRVHFEGYEPNPLYKIIFISPDTVLTKDGKYQSVSGVVESSSGLKNKTGVSGINIDKTPPAILGYTTQKPNLNGWYNTDVSVYYKATDNLSGIQMATPGETIAQEGYGLTSEGTAVDYAGNKGSCSLSGINIDKTAPDIQISYPADGAEYILNEDIRAEFTCDDTVSGVAQLSSTCELGAKIDTSSVGVKTFEVKVTDNAGNESVKTVKYYVRYRFSGLLNTFNDDMTFNTSRALPLTFNLSDVSGDLIVNAGAKLYVSKFVDGYEQDETEAVSVNSKSAFEYDPDMNEYKFVLKLSSLSTGTWRLKIKLDDLSVYTYDITLK